MINYCDELLFCGQWAWYSDAHDAVEGTLQVTGITGNQEVDIRISGNKEHGQDARVT